MPDFPTYSLQRRLLGWLLVPLFLMSSAIVYEAYSSASSSAQEIYDKILLGLALNISEHAVITEGDLLSDEMLELLHHSTQETFFYKVTGPGNAFITGYQGIPPVPDHLKLKEGGPLFYDTTYQGLPVRMVALTIHVDQIDLSGLVSVQVLQTKGERKAMVRGAVYRSALHVVLVLAFATVFTWIGVNRGLRPLKKLENAIRRRSYTDLRPIIRNVPKEIEQVVLATNNLFGRLEKSIQRSKTFIETASHQLRTPLSALKARLELSIRNAKTDRGRQTLSTIHEETVRASRLTDQLLSLARIEPIALGETPERQIDLVKLCSDVAIEWVNRALAKNIEIAFETDENLGPLYVDGNRILLTEVPTNLIHNAINYCPSGASIVIRVGLMDKSRIFLEVEDNGPGIDHNNRNRVFDRFVRLDYADGKGCGLGLPIVKEIVTVHFGSIQLLDGAEGQGLLVHIEFPRSISGGKDNSVHSLNV